MKATQNTINQLEAIVPNLGVFMERIRYRARRIEEYRQNPCFTPLERLKAILTIDDEFDWIVHLRKVQQTEVMQLPAQTNQQAA